MKLSEFKNVWEHAQDSCYEGKLRNATRTIHGINESCGDEIVFYLKLDKKKQIKEVSFTHQGCTLSYIACSLLSEKIIGKTFKEIKKMRDDDFLKLFSITVSESRLKCVFLPFHTILTSQ